MIWRFNGVLQYVIIKNGDSKSIFPTSLPSGSQTWTYLDLRQVLRHPWLQKYFRAFLQQLQQHTARARATSRLHSEGLLVTSMALRVPETLGVSDQQTCFFCWSYMGNIHIFRNNMGIYAHLYVFRLIYDV